MGIVLSDMVKSDIEFVKNLYIEAFPPEERAPFGYIKRRHFNGKARMFVASRDGGKIGFAYIIEHNDVVYLLFLAVNGAERGKGYGTEILSLIKDMFKGKRLLIAREPIDENADNNAQRVARHKFYLKNGFTDSDCKIHEAGVTYDVMTVGGDVSPDEYRALITRWTGRFILLFVKMEMTRK